MTHDDVNEDDDDRLIIKNNIDGDGDGDDDDDDE